MSALLDRRPRLITSISSPDVFCRPMDPGPAPLVYINGWHGIGKETVAECLTLLLGRDKSLLIDVRGVGRDNVAAPSICGAPGRAHEHKHRQRREHNPLLTPEHPRYFSFDPDFGPNLPSPSAASFGSVSSRSASFSSDTTTATNTTAASSVTGSVSTSVSACVSGSSTHPAVISSRPPSSSATIPEVLGCSVQPVPVRVAVPVPVVVPVPVAVSDPIPAAVHVPFSCSETPVAAATAATVAVLPTLSAPATQAAASTPAAPSTTTTITTTAALSTTTTIPSPTTSSIPTGPLSTAAISTSPPTTTTTTIDTTTTTTSTSTATTTQSTPCSSENLTRLLTHPLNRRRIAVLAACSPDTPAGRAALATFQAAAVRAGRAFVPVALTCAPREHARRAGAVGMGVGCMGGGGGGGVTGLGTGMGMGGGLGVGEGRVLRSGSDSGAGAGAGAGAGSTTASLGCGGGGVLVGHAAAAARSRSRGALVRKRGLSESFVAAGGAGAGAGGGSGDSDVTLTEGAACEDGDESDHACAAGGGQLVGPRPRGRLISVPVAMPVVPIMPVQVPEVHGVPSMAAATGIEVEWAQGQGLAMPAGTGLTVDITNVPAFEAALQIVEVVRGVEAERDAETCSTDGGSPATTPGDGRAGWQGVEGSGLGRCNVRQRQRLSYEGNPSLLGPSRAG